MTRQRQALLAALLVLLLVVATASGAGAAEWQVGVVDSAGDVGQHAAIAVDSLNRPHLSYYDAANGALKYAYWTGSAWAIEQVDGGGYIGEYTSIVVDSSNNPHITYHDSLNNTLKYAFRTSTGWTIETVPTVGQVGLYSSLVIDPAGDAHVAFESYWPQALQYAVRTDGVWSVETVEAGSVGQYASLALDPAGRPHLSYYDAAASDLSYAVKSATGWTLETVDSTGTVGEFYTSIEINSNGNPCITYYDTTNGDLKYAAKTGDSWQVSVIDAVGVVGPYSSLALDGSDEPRVSYYDNTNTALKYAEWNGTGWMTETVDNDGRVGTYTSLALDRNGNVHIGYYDSTNGDLKYARGTAAALPVPIASVSPETVDFGRVPLGALATRQVTVTNEGDGALELDGVAVEGAGFTVVPESVPAAPIAPGDSAVLAVQFSPGEIGETSGTVVVRSNDPVQDTLRVELLGEGSLGAVADLKPDTLNLGSNRESLTAYVELPVGQDPQAVDISTVTLTIGDTTVTALESPYTAGDYDADGLSDLMVKFPSQPLLGNLAGGSLEATVTGVLVTGESFVGTDLVQTTGATANATVKGNKKLK